MGGVLFFVHYNGKCSVFILLVGNFELDQTSRLLYKCVTIVSTIILFGTSSSMICVLRTSQKGRDVRRHQFVTTCLRFDKPMNYF